MVRRVAQAADRLEDVRGVLQDQPVRVGAPFRIDTPNGPLKVAELGKNAFVGEMAILCDVPRTASVAATEPVTTLKISKDLFFRLVTEFPQMSVEIAVTAVK